MAVKRKVVGLMTCCAGAGMIFVIIIPCWGLMLAVLLLAFGIWELLD